MKSKQSTSTLNWGFYMGKENMFASLAVSTKESRNQVRDTESHQLFPFYLNQAGIQPGHYSCNNAIKTWGDPAQPLHKDNTFGSPPLHQALICLWLRRAVPPSSSLGWGFGGFPANSGGLASPSPGSWRLPGQRGMAADLKDTLLKRLSHVSADHVFSLSTLWVQIPLYNRSQTEKALCIK